MNIEDTQERHRAAMESVDKALDAKRRGDQPLSMTFLREAFQLEKEAAAAIANDFKCEPSRSVLHRSAASLALQCGETREAERLIGAALAGFPPEEIAEELRDLLEQIYSNRTHKNPKVPA
jgi:hypothetical protein